MKKIDRVKLMSEVTKRMSKNTLSPVEGWYCLKAISRHMTDAERERDMAWTEGYLTALTDLAIS